MVLIVERISMSACIMHDMRGRDKDEVSQPPTIESGILSFSPSTISQQLVCTKSSLYVKKPLPYDISLLTNCKLYSRSKFTQSLLL